MNDCISANFAILGMFFGSHSTILMWETIFAEVTKSKSCTFWTRILQGVTGLQTYSTMSLLSF